MRGGGCDLGGFVLRGFGPTVSLQGGYDRGGYVRTPNEKPLITLKIKITDKNSSFATIRACCEIVN